MPFKIALVEDNVAFQLAVKTIIEAEPDWVLTKIFNSAEEALNILNDPPDLLILDIQLPRMNGLELLIHLKKTESPMRILICSMHDKDEKIIAALQNGACGYILKDGRVNDIRSAVYDIINVGAALSPYIAKRVVAFFNNPAIRQSIDVLSDREHEVLLMLSDGLQKKEVAHKLGISVETVKKHVSNIYHKLRVQNVVEAVNKLRLR